MKKLAQSKLQLGPLEDAVMRLLWSHKTMTAEEVRAGLIAQHDVRDSTVRTVLRRLEDKGFVHHDLDGRTFVYRATVARQSIASDAVRRIVDCFCAGSVERLLLGLVDDRLITARKLRELADKISEAETKQKSAKS